MDFSLLTGSNRHVHEVLRAQAPTNLQNHVQQERTPIALDPFLAFHVHPEHLLVLSVVWNVSTAPMVGFSVNQRNLFARKLMPAKSSRKEEAHQFKFLWDRKFVMTRVMAVKALLRLKLAQQASTDKNQSQRIGVMTVKLENQVHKEQRNVKHGAS